jgi:hypothetical protein
VLKFAHDGFSIKRTYGFVQRVRAGAQRDILAQEGERSRDREVMDPTEVGVCTKWYQSHFLSVGCRQREVKSERIYSDTHHQVVSEKEFLSVYFR